MSGETQTSEGGAPDAAASTTPDADPGKKSGASDGGGTSTASAPVVDTQKIHDDGFDKGFGKGKAKGKKELLDELGVTPEEVAELKKLKNKVKEDEEAKRREKGEYEQLLADKDAQHQRELAERDKRQADLEARQNTLAVRTALASAIAGSDALPAANEQITTILEKHLDVDKDTGEVVVLTATGAAKLDAETNRPMTPSKFVKAWLAENKHFQRATNPSGGSGTQSTEVSKPTSQSIVADLGDREALLKKYDGKPEDLIAAGMEAEFGKKNLDGKHQSASGS